MPGGGDQQRVVPGLRTMERYDPTTNRWYLENSLPTPRSRIAVATLEGKLYAIGGYAELC